MAYLSEKQKQWCIEHSREQIDLLKTIGRIPAPSHCEEKRAAYIYKWLKENGAENVRIDEAKNVIFEFGSCDQGMIDVVMAHTDIVFPDTEDLPLCEDGNRIFAPGIGDDTANLVNLLFAVKYMLENKESPKHGIVIVADSCEEGLGNLKGSRRIIDEYGDRIRSLVSLDLYTGLISSRVVGSHRYRITVRAKGGHAYGDFGNSNAIHHAAQIIQALYQREVPTKPKTTYNVGVISGGTTINSICAECSILYEYRSESGEQLRQMQMFLEDTINGFGDKGFDIEVEKIGERPCSGDVDQEQLNILENAMAYIMRENTDVVPKTGEALSTDCNAAQAVGIPAVCMGTVMGGGAHTRGEWIDINSMEKGLQIALSVILYISKELSF